LARATCGSPNLQRLGTVMVGETVREQLRLDHDLEKAAI
jgi:bacterioferritin (cytochrome b1)